MDQSDTYLAIVDEGQEKQAKEVVCVALSKQGGCSRVRNHGCQQGGNKMPIPRREVPRFAAEAVCSGRIGKDEIVGDLMEAGVTRSAAQRLFEEMTFIRKEMRATSNQVSEDEVLKAWTDQGTPLVFVPVAARPFLVAAVLFSISILLFLLSLTQDVFYREQHPREPETETGLLLLLFGWLAVFEGVLAWLANPALFVAWITMWFRPTFAAAAAVVSLLFSLSFLGIHTIPPDPRVISHGPGYWIWVLSIVSALVASVLAIWRPRPNTRGETSASDRFAVPDQQDIGK
jgi:hypothetical protein